MTKFKELKNLPKKNIKQKIEDLKLEIIKARVAANKGGKVKLREMKRTLARLIMLNNKS